MHRGIEIYQVTHSPSFKQEVTYWLLELLGPFPSLINAFALVCSYLFLASISLKLGLEIVCPFSLRLIRKLGIVIMNLYRIG